MVIPAGRFTETKAVQLSKTPSPTSVAEAGISRPVRLVQFLNALFPIFVRLEGRSMAIKEVQPENIPALTVLNPSVNVTELRDAQPSKISSPT